MPKAKRQPVQFFPVHFAHILLWRDERHRHKDVYLRVWVWRTLGEMRQANGHSHRNKFYALCWQMRGKIFAELHFAANSIQVDLTSHECHHALVQLISMLDLDITDAEDEEISCEITGLMNYLVTEELDKVKALTGKSLKSG